MKNRRTALLLLCAAGACKNPNTPYFGTTTPRHDDQELWINLGSEPETIDPHKASDSVAHDILENISAGLVSLNPADLRPQPGIAQHWEIEEQGHLYTFHLHKSAWSDGAPLTAYDFEWSWKRLLNPDTAAKYGMFLYSVENAEAYNQRALYVSGEPATPDEKILRQKFKTAVEKIERVKNADGYFVYIGGPVEKRADLRRALIAQLHGQSVAGAVLTVRVAGADLVGVHARDEQTLVVRLNDPVPYFLHLLSFYATFPVPKHLFERLEREGRRLDSWTQVGTFVSNGAYTIQEWQFRERLVLQQNPFYWDAANVRIPRIVLSEIESYHTALNLYRTGYLDYIGTNTHIPAEFLSEMSRYKDFHHDPQLTVYLLWLNLEKPPLDNILVRRALSLAIDRQLLVDRITRGKQIPSANLVPEGLNGFHGDKRSLFDPEAARALLKKAGYNHPGDVPPITFIYNTSEMHKQIAEALQAMWKSNLGLDVRIQNREWKVLLKDLDLKNFQIGRLGWVADYADPNTFLDILSAHNGNNHSNWSDTEYDSLLQKANRELDPALRMKFLQHAEKIALDAQPIIPLYVYTRSYMLKPYIRGFWGNLLDIHPYKYMWMDQAFK